MSNALTNLGANSLAGVVNNKARPSPSTTNRSPSGVLSTEIVERWEVVNPVVLQGWTSFEMGFDYVISGQRCCRSILFINLKENRQIHLIVDAGPDEFGPLYKTVYRTLATWWEADGV